MFSLLTDSILIRIQPLVLMLGLTLVPVLEAQADAGIDVDRLCQSSPADCLVRLEPLLRSTPANSHRWFNLKSYQLESLFILEDFARLKRESLSLLQSKRLPPVLEVKAEIYLAKSLIILGERKDGEAHLNSAIEKLEQLNQVVPNPLRLVEVANLYLYLDQSEQALSFLQKLKHKYGHIQDPVFNMELYGNLSHAARNLGMTDEFIEYALLTLKWGKIEGNLQQIGVAYKNLGRAYLQAEQFDDALASFKRGVEHAVAAGDLRLEHKLYLLMAKTHYKAGERQRSQQYLEQIEPTKLMPTHRQDYQKLSDLMVVQD